MTMRLPGTLFSYASGLLIAPYLFLPDTLPLLILVSVGAWGFSRSKRLSTCSLVLLFFCIGLFQYRISISPPQTPDSIHLLTDHGPVLVEGTIDSVNVRSPQGAVCIITVTASFSDGLKTARSGMLLLRIDQLGAPLSPGDRIRFQTQLHAPRLFGTPGEFNYPRHLAHERVFTTGFIQNSNAVVTLQKRSPQTPGTLLRQWSQYIGEIIDNSAPPHLAPYLRGLATGDRGALSSEQRELLAHSGLSHLFAISGLHLGIIASALYLLLLTGYRRSRFMLFIAPPRRVLPFLILPVVAAYMIFTGGALSTLRAFLCLAAVTAAFFLRRQVAPLQLLAAAALIMLLLDPLAIFTPAFQLSFAGAAGILCIMPRWVTFSQNRPKALVYPATLFVVTLAATVSTLPLVLLHFHIFAPAGLILNMIAVPAVTLLAVPLCLTGVVTAAFSPETAAIIFNLAAAVLDSILNMSRTVLEIPGLSAHYLYLPALTLTGVGLFVLTLFVPIRPRIRVTGLTLSLLLLSSTLFYNINPGRLSIVAISVGQGDAALVTTSVGKTFLIDGGGFSRSTYDTGERLVAPALGHLGVSVVDTVVLTHTHPDHMNGLLHILQNFPVRSFWSGTAIEALPKPLQEILTERQIPIRTFAENWSKVEKSDNSQLAVYRVPNRPGSRNDQSLILYFQQGSDGLLLTGDLEESGINQLSLKPPPGPVTLLKIPHHGSRYSSPRSLLELLRPQAAYISVGYNNRYGQPHDEILSLLKNRSIRLERTDLSGSLYFQTKGESWGVKRWDKGVFR